MKRGEGETRVTRRESLEGADRCSSSRRKEGGRGVSVGLRSEKGGKDGESDLFSRLRSEWGEGRERISTLWSREREREKKKKPRGKEGQLLVGRYREN